jgi:hypothetical protein
MHNLLPHSHAQAHPLTPIAYQLAHMAPEEVHDIRNDKDSSLTIFN